MHVFAELDQVPSTPGLMPEQNDNQDFLQRQPDDISTMSDSSTPSGTWFGVGQEEEPVLQPPPSSPPTESLRDDIGTIRDARPSSTTELTVSKVGDFLEALRVKHQVSHAGVRAVYDFFIKENAQEIYEAYLADKFPSIWTLTKNSKSDIPMTSVNYVMLNEEGQQIKETNKVSLPRELVLKPERLLRLCAANKLQDLHKFYWDRHHTSAEPYPGTNGAIITMSSDGVKETNVQKKKLHILSVCFDGCNQPVPW